MKNAYEVIFDRLNWTSRVNSISGGTFSILIFLKSARNVSGYHWIINGSFNQKCWQGRSIGFYRYLPWKTNEEFSRFTDLFLCTLASLMEAIQQDDIYIFLNEV